MSNYSTKAISNSKTKLTTSSVVPSLKRPSVLEGHSNQVTHLAFSPDSLWVVTASGDETIILWTTRYGRIYRAWLAHSGGVRCAAFSPDSGRLATAGDDSLVVVWSVSTDQKLAALEIGPSAETLATPLPVDEYPTDCEWFLPSSLGSR